MSTQKLRRAGGGHFFAMVRQMAILIMALKTATAARLVAPRNFFFIKHITKIPYSTYMYTTSYLLVVFLAIMHYSEEIFVVPKYFKMEFVYYIEVQDSSVFFFHIMYSLYKGIPTARRISF